MSHLTYISATARSIDGGDVTISGTSYSVSKGKTYIGSTGYDISFVEIIESVPSQSGSLTYSGSAKSPSWSNYNSSELTIGGTTSATNAGTYTATFTPKAGYVWSDGTTAAKSVNWTIGKKAGTISISTTSLSFTSGTAKTITVTLSGGGTATVKTSNSSVAAVSVSGTTVTVTPRGDGSATLTISGTSTNYSYGSKTCSVSCSLPKCTITLSGEDEGDTSDCYVIISGTKYSKAWSTKSLEQVYIPNYGYGYDYVYKYYTLTVPQGAVITLRAYGNCYFEVTNVPSGSNVSAGDGGTIPSYVRKRTGTSTSYTTLATNGTTTYTVTQDIDINFSDSSFGSNEYVNASGTSYTLTITE